MIFICVIVVVAADDHLQELRDIYAQEAEQHRQRVAAMDRTGYHATCTCGWSSTGYQTPGRAKMGLKAHQQRRKCEGRT